MTLNSGDVKEIHRILSLPRWPADTTEPQRLELMREEAFLRDQLIRYNYAFDAGDLETILSYFADDCVMTNPRVRCVGMAQIREEYETVMASWSMTRHLWINVAVQFPYRVDEAYRTAYFNTFLVNDDQSINAVGTDIQRLSKVRGNWKIVERWVSHDLNQPITLSNSPVVRANTPR